MAVDVAVEVAMAVAVAMDVAVVVAMAVAVAVAIVVEVDYKLKKLKKAELKNWKREIERERKVELIQMRAELLPLLSL